MTQSTCKATFTFNHSEIYYRIGFTRENERWSLFSTINYKVIHVDYELHFKRFLMGKTEKDGEKKDEAKNNPERELGKELAGYTGTVTPDIGSHVRF